MAVYRNSSGSFEMATVILAAFAIDAWRCRPIASKLPVLAALGITSFFVWRAYVFAAPLITRLLLLNTYRRSQRESILFAACLMTTAAICATAPCRRKAALLAAVVACESMVLYAVPTLSGLRDVTEDLTPLTFLSQHLGWQRAYLLGTVHPNYGSYYQIPFIDHESLPVSDAWIGYLKRTLDPDIDSVTFSGDYPGPATARQSAMRAHLAGLEQTGIRYVAVPRDSRPFAMRTGVPHQPGGNYPATLDSGQQISGILTKLTEEPGLVDSAAILVGTGEGKASGVLTIELCSPAHCSTGTAILEGAKDNAPLNFDLKPSLTLESGIQLKYTFKHLNGLPVAVWIFPAAGSGAATTLSDGHSVEVTPDVGLYSTTGGQPERVFQSATSDIFELPRAAGYFTSANGACTSYG